MQNNLFRLIVTTRKVVYLTLGKLDTLVLKKNNNLFILSYHSINEDEFRFSVDFKTLKQQITYLKKHFQFITLSDVVAYQKGKKQINRPSVVLTFDDGYKNVLTTKDYLKKQGIKPALFLLADTKNANFTQLAAKPEFLNKREILSLVKAGWEIGCHSSTHANLSLLSEEEVKREVIGSRKKLEKELGISVPYFAYPRGKYSKLVLESVKKAKYSLALTMDDGFIDDLIDIYKLPRVGVDRTHTLAEFQSSFSPSVVKFRKAIKESYFGKYI